MNLLLYLMLQGIIIVLTLVFICYLIKEFLIPIINNKIEKEAKEIVYKKDKIKEPQKIIETETEVIYYYDNGDEYHSPIRRE